MGVIPKKTMGVIPKKHEKVEIYCPYLMVGIAFFAQKFGNLENTLYLCTVHPYAHFTYTNTIY